MRYLEFNLSDFGSLQKNLIENYSLKETAFHTFKNDESTPTMFFQRIYVESGAEIWIYYLKFVEDTNFKQIATNPLFSAIHFLSTEHPIDNDIDAIYQVNGSFDLNIKFRKFQVVKGISFIYSKRWSDANLNKSPSLQVIFDKIESAKKIFFTGELKSKIDSFMHLALQNKFDSFLLKVKILGIIDNSFALITYGAGLQIKKQDRINLLISYIEEQIYANFNITMKSIYAEIKVRGFNVSDFEQKFKQKNNLSIMQFKTIKKAELAIKLLNDGRSTQDIAQRIGFKSSSKFIDYFKKRFGIPPQQYLRNQLGQTHEN